MVANRTVDGVLGPLGVLVPRGKFSVIINLYIHFPVVLKVFFCLIK